MIKKLKKKNIIVSSGKVGCISGLSRHAMLRYYSSVFDCSVDRVVPSMTNIDFQLGLQAAGT